MKVGDKILTYEIIKVLLKETVDGGMGELYLAEDCNLNRKKVVIKFLKEEFSFNNNLRKRFIYEAETHSKFNHPNICQLITACDYGKRLCMIMEYIPGKTLKDLGKISWQAVVDIAIQTLEALDYIHNFENSTVHRDIKPSNIMVTPDGKVKVIDFGVAKEDKKKLTGTHVIIGTPDYMSPEQALGKKVDALSDLYSLGITIYEVLKGEDVFHESLTSQEIIQWHIDKFKNFPKLRTIDKTIPKWLDSVVSKAMAKDVSKRFQSALEFKKALETERNQKYKPPVKQLIPTYFKVLFFLLLICAGTLLYLTLQSDPEPEPEPEPEPKPIILSPLIRTNTEQAKVKRNYPISINDKVAQFDTIQGAINSAKSGDTLYISDSKKRYMENLVINKKITLKGEGKVIVYSTKSHEIFADCIIDGIIFEKTNGKKDKLPIIDLNNTVSTIRNCEVKNGYVGIRIVNGNSIIERCKLRNNETGILIKGEESEPILKENSCTENVFGIAFIKAAKGKAEKNICSNNRLHGIYIRDKNTEPEIIGNYCNENKECGIAIENSSPIVKKNKCIGNLFGIFARKSSAKFENNYYSDNKTTNFLTL